MAAPRFTEQLNAQIGNELAAQHQYLACAVHYDALTMPRMAAFFYQQALEERGHAMMMVQYLLDAGEQPSIPGVAEPSNDFTDVVEPIRIALEQEKRVTDQISGLAAIAREASDYVSEQFTQWFLKEQVEEVATMSDLLAVAERAGDRWSDIEDFIAREHPGDEGGDPTSPTPAGG